jgi:V/A-type H+-transporting ATPase subunit I
MLFIWGLVVWFGTQWGLKGLATPGEIVGILMMLLGVVAAAYGGGFGGGIEAALAFGNILSYARLYGIGLASVILAEVANTLGAKFTGVLIPVGIIVAVLLHTLNLLLGILSPSIQYLRLNLVESFTKFYKEAEVEYKPFKKMGGD